MLHSGRDEIYNSGIEGYSEVEYTDFAIGISAGGKFISRRGFVAEVYLGIGRGLLGESDIEVVGRGGIAFGFRF